MLHKLDLPRTFAVPQAISRPLAVLRLWSVGSNDFLTWITARSFDC